MPRKPKEFNKRDALFTERLNHLFTTRMDPEGKPYSVRGVAEATGISATYVSNMRTGKVGLPGLDKLEALAGFFGVPVSYFMGTEAAAAEPAAPLTEDAELRKALENPLVREIALQTGQFGPEEWKHMLAILEHQVALQRLAAERARREQAQEDNAPRDITEHARRKRGRRPPTDGTP